jgi:outer membrane protein OmpA-like peptidoglycan-associated protein
MPEVGVPRARIPEPSRPVGTTGVTIRKDPYLIEFHVGTSQMTSKSANELREVARVLSANPRARADVNGYTDNAGNAESNRRLSEARARATMDELAGLGVDRSRIQAHGYGEDHPVADNATAEGRQRNRRVEIVVTDR